MVIHQVFLLYHRETGYNSLKTASFLQNIWGETTDGVDGGDIDWNSEVYVGRISVDNATEAYNQIQKIIASETTIRPNRTLMVGEKLDNDPTWGGDRMDWVYSYMDGIPVTKLYDKVGTWSNQELIDLINDPNQKHYWINHLGHSNSTYSMKLYNNDINYLHYQYWNVHLHHILTTSTENFRWQQDQHKESMYGQ